jgi:hypothetical protein
MEEIIETHYVIGNGKQIDETSDREAFCGSREQVQFRHAMPIRELSALIRRLGAHDEGEPKRLPALSLAPDVSFRVCGACPGN